MVKHMDFEEWMHAEKQSVSDITEEMMRIEIKIRDYAFKRAKEKFPDVRVEKKDFSKDLIPLAYIGSLRAVTGKTFFTNDKRVIQFVERTRVPEGVPFDENPAEIHLTLDPIYKAMFKEHEALKVKYADRNMLLVHAGEYEKQRDWLQAQVVHNAELEFQAKQIQDKLADLEISINSQMEKYSRCKDAYQQLQAEYSQAVGCIVE